MYHFLLVNCRGGHHVYIYLSGKWIFLKKFTICLFIFFLILLCFFSLSLSSTGIKETIYIFGVCGSWDICVLEIVERHFFKARFLLFFYICALQFVFALHTRFLSMSSACPSIYVNRLLPLSLKLKLLGSDDIVVFCCLSI